MGNFRGIFYALISSATFGLVPFFSIALLDSGLSAATVLFYRMGVGALLIGGIAVLQKKSFAITFQDLLKIIVLGGLYAATALALIISYSYIPSGIATTIHFLYPVLLFKEKCSLGLIAAAVVSLIGVALLSWSNSAYVNIKGIAIVLITVLTYGSYIVGVNKSGVDRIDSLLLTFYVLVVATIVCGIVAGCTSGIGRIHTGNQAINVLLIALVPTVISNLTLILAVKHVGSTITAILGSLEPLTAVLVGIFWFREPFNVQYAAGLLLILVSVSLVVWLNRRRTN